MLRTNLISDPNEFGYLWTLYPTDCNNFYNSYNSTTLINMIKDADGLNFIRKALDINLSIAGNILPSQKAIMTFIVMLNTYISSANMETIWYKMVGSYGQYYSSFQLSELDLYGAKRLGTIQDTLKLNSFYFNGSYNAASNSYNISSTYTPRNTAQPNLYLTSFTYGKKQYEITNHLGNVLSTVSDYKLPYLNSSGKLCYNPDVRSENKYYAFGGAKDGNYIANVNNNYRFSFNGKPDDAGTGLQDYGMRMYDDEIGRFLSVDPIASRYPNLTPFQFASNKPIWAIDLDGLEAYFTNNGTFIKWGEDKSKTAPVIVVIKDKEVTLKAHDKDITFEQFINRVNWAYGESGGDQSVSNYYSHTINNLSKSFTTEDYMYHYANCGKDNGVEQNKKDLFGGTGHGYKKFAQIARKNNEDLETITNINEMAKDASTQSVKAFIASTIAALIGDEDIVFGATNWVGDQKKDWAMKNSKASSTVTTVTTLRKFQDFRKKTTHNVTHSFHKLKVGGKTNIKENNVDLSTNK